jgi:hypothetical protein
VTGKTAPTGRTKVGTAIPKLAARAVIISVFILALAAAVILSRHFQPPKCVVIGGVLVVAGKCP